MDEDEGQKECEHREVDTAGDLAVDPAPAHPESGGDGRSLQQSGDERQRRGDEDRGEVGEDLGAVAMRLAFVRRQVQ
ncbi:hypothetical protein ACQEV9_08070 [Streptomyces chartreusis]|uniref:hypothetical protein n=1 Tax=Streptomyces chartreusis TaxID=1969 RepID=UPI003D9395B7